MKQHEEYSDLEGGGRIPPQAVEVEENVLGGCLTENEALEEAIAELGHDPSVFYKPAHRTIYEAILEINRRNGSIDIITIENYLRDNHLLAPVGGSGTLQELTRRVSSAANMDYHCAILLEKWVKRQLILDANDIQKGGYDSTSDPFDLLDQAMTNVDKIADRLYRQKGSFASDMMKGVLEDIEWRRENPGITGVPSGTPVDKYTGGWQPGNLYIIAARPSIGKTAFIIKAGFNAALFAAERYRTNVFHSNLEMQNEDLIKRRLSMEAKVNSTKIRDGKVSDIEMQRLVEAAGHLYDGRVILDDTPGININEWRAKYKTAVRRHGVGLGIVDYLQLMSGKSEGTREQEIASISRGLKAAAKETNTPIVALSQLSRECERREGAEPFLSDLRESGSLEQDADGVIMLNRPEFFGHAKFKNRPTEGKGIVKIVKMRNGMTGEFWMDFVKKYADWQPEYSDRAGITKDDSAIDSPKAPIPHSLFSEDEEYIDDEEPF